MQVALNDVRFSYFTGVTPRPFEEGDEPSYGTKGLFPKDEFGKENYNKILNAIKKVAMAQWKDKAGAMLKTMRAKDRLCLHDGENMVDDDGNVQDGYEGMWFIGCSQSDLTKPPKIFSQSGRQVTTENRSSFSDSDGVPYSGAYGRLLVEVWAQDNKWGKRVNARFLAASYSAFGEPFGATGISAEDARAGLGIGEPDPVGDLENEGEEAEGDGEESLDDLFDDVNG